MQAFFRGLIFVIFAVPSMCVFAFGPQGHQQVGAIAAKLLEGTTAEQQVASLLNGMSLETVAVWADCAKGVTSADGVNFTYRAMPDNFPECEEFNTADDKKRFESFAGHNWKQCGATHGREYCHNQYHYADISNLHSEYLPNYSGANNHDIVHSINAAISVLKDQTPASPFSFQDKKEALMLLAHYVGDIHQPLHVVAIYLNGDGNIINPDAAGNKTIYETAGGNLLEDGSESLHHEWDATPAAMTIAGKDKFQLLKKATQVVPTSGDIFTWSTLWATETINTGKVAFSDLSFTPFAKKKTKAKAPKWNVLGADADYTKHATELKAQQIAKAGARLAQILKTIWPDSGSASNTPTAYLLKSELPDLKLLLPAAPAKNTSALTSDIEIFNATRKILHTPRGLQAANDDVFEPTLILERFKEATGVVLTSANAPTLISLITKSEIDIGNIISPIKLPVAEGGRKRPFVEFKNSETCLYPVDMAGHADVDINRFHIGATGAYPSGHATTGMLVGMILSAALPNQSTAILKRGIEFGESRVICGFHYESDVVAGRLAASILFARLQAQPEFVNDMNKVKVELQNAVNHR